MKPQSQDVENQSNRPPKPGGDPAQQPKNLPTPRPEQDNKGKGKDKDKENEKDTDGYGRISKKDVRSSKDAPEPHQIF